jgi:signal transduction histidine kinase
MRKKVLIFCAYFVCNVFICLGQTKAIEIAKKQLALARNEQQRLDALFLLCEQRHSLSADTLHKYSLQARRLSDALNTPHNQALANYYVANYYVKTGELDTALMICDSSIEKLEAKKIEIKLTSKLHALKAQVLVKANKYKEGLSEFYKTLSIAEKSNDTLMQMIAKNGIGWVYMEMDQNDEALKWFYRALATSDNIAFHLKNANIYSNIAAIYIGKHKSDSTTYFVQKAIDFSKRDENLFFLSNSLNILADNYIALKEPALAEGPLQEAIKIRELIGDPFYIVSDLSQLAIFYAEQGKSEKGIAASLKGIDLARKYNLRSKLPYLQFALAQNYKAAGKYLKYGETLENVLALKDSVYQLNTEKALVQIRAQYNHEKQENLIIQQKLDINRKNTALLIAIITVIFGTILSLLLFANYKRRQKQVVNNIKLEEKLKAEKAIIAAQENERRRISADLHDNLGAYASAISSNVDDLVSSTANFDESVLENIKSNASDIMNSLRETIWVLNKSAIQITNVSDRFKNYMSRITEAYPGLTLNINEHIEDNKRLAPEAALNLLRILQEAFHNAIKHSKGDCITVDIVSNDGIEITVTDNGEGITDITINGNGISNMKKRAKANGWILHVKNGQPKGTVVELRSE